MDELIKLEALVLLPVSHNRAALGINQRLVQQKSASLLKLVALSWPLCLHRGNIPFEWRVMVKDEGCRCY